MGKKLEHLPAHTKREIEKIQMLVAPLIKKSSIYMLLSIPMIVFSLLNLAVIVFRIPTESFLTLVVFSLIGALGFALFKEALHQNKKIQKASIDYIKERIKKSSLVPENSKDMYIEKIQKDPINAFQVFSVFLNQEQRIKKLDEESYN